MLEGIGTSIKLVHLCKDKRKMLAKRKEESPFGLGVYALGLCQRVVLTQSIWSGLFCSVKK
ncbi:MAG TPA: hypothetical protein DCR93_33585 [Cytophagales bacterium]|nr:hypothetical protein [Cytophagales bacterium]